MRTLKNASTPVSVLDEPADGGAHHVYYAGEKEVSRIFFQKGPVKEVGPNGCQNEDLVAIVIDRLECFQRGAFSCRENALALTKLQEALHWMKHRTTDREGQGVEGTNDRRK